MYRLSKQFALVCGPALIVVGVLLVMLYQSAVTSAMIELGERSNLSLAWATLSSSRPQVIEFLEQSATANQATGSQYAIDERFTASVNILLTETRVFRVKIYDANGIVAYSTKADQIGDHRSDNPGFLMGMQGDVSSELIVRGSFDAFEQRTESEHLIHTYIPIQPGPASPIVGVLEIYTNVDHLFENIAHSKLKVSIVAFVILAGLFIVLWWSSVRAERTIIRQRTVIDERNHSLELLAERLSSTQEAERQRVSRELGEGLGQTLAAIKLRIENGQSKSMPENDETLIRLIQQAMAEVRRTATDLRPASLDEAGVISTIAWYCRQFEAAHPDIVVEPDLSVTDSEVPRRLSTAIFRTVQETLRDLARFTDTHWVSVSLDREDESLKLNFLVQVPPGNDDAEGEELATESRLQHALAPLRERATLFGAQFKVSQTGELEIEVTCIWSVANVSYLRTSDRIDST